MILSKYVFFAGLCLGDDRIKMVNVNSEEETYLNERTNSDEFKRLFPRSPLANFYITDLGQRIGLKNAQKYYESHIEARTMPVSTPELTRHFYVTIDIKFSFFFLKLS